MENRRKRVLSSILIVFILAGIVIFIVLAVGIFYYHFAEPASLGIYE